MMRKLVLLVCAAGLIAVAGCGGDDDGDAGGDAAPTTDAEFVAQVEEACGAAAARSEELRQELGETPAVSPEAVPVLEDTVVAVDEFVAALSEIEPPADKADTYDEYLAAFEESTNILPGLINALEAGDQAAAEELAVELNEVDPNLEPLTRELGIEDCASGGSSDAE
jgi:hypothetical protein